MNDQFIRGLRVARDLALDLEVEYAPEDDSDCCKCEKSHAKADAYANIADAIETLITNFSRIGHKPSE